MTDTGLIATNAHVAREEESLLARLSGGVQLEASVAYIDEDVDIALLKVEGANFPHLELAERINSASRTGSFRRRESRRSDGV